MPIRPLLVVLALALVCALPAGAQVGFGRVIVSRSRARAAAGADPANAANKSRSINHVDAQES